MYVERERKNTGTKQWWVPECTPSATVDCKKERYDSGSLRGNLGPRRPWKHTPSCFGTLFKPSVLIHYVFLPFFFFLSFFLFLIRIIPFIVFFSAKYLNKHVQLIGNFFFGLFDQSLLVVVTIFFERRKTFMSN